MNLYNPKFKLNIHSNSKDYQEEIIIGRSSNHHKMIKIIKMMYGRISEWTLTEDQGVELEKVCSNSEMKTNGMSKNSQPKLTITHKAAHITVSMKMDTNHLRIRIRFNLRKTMFMDKTEFSLVTKEKQRCKDLKMMKMMEKKCTDKQCKKYRISRAQIMLIMERVAPICRLGW